ncbi:MAG TPA: hypothetical protein VEW65_16065 [Chryseolinea sp.]|nr:hypothetical protein [Chryseolinea sp.]
MKTLKNVLLLNALSSGATAVGLIAFAAPVAILFGLEKPTPVIEVGIFLLLFAIFVFLEGRKTAQNPNMVKLIIGLDLGWVLASSSIVALQLFSLTLLGYFAISAVALWVAGMAYLQIGGLKRLTIA